MATVSSSVCDGCGKPTHGAAPNLRLSARKGKAYAYLTVEVIHTDESRQPDICQACYDELTKALEVEGQKVVEGVRASHSFADRILRGPFADLVSLWKPGTEPVAEADQANPPDTMQPLTYDQQVDHLYAEIKTRHRDGLHRRPRQVHRGG